MPSKSLNTSLVPFAPNGSQVPYKLRWEHFMFRNIHKLGQMNGFATSFLERQIHVHQWWLLSPSEGSGESAWKLVFSYSLCGQELGRGHDQGGQSHSEIDKMKVVSEKPEYSSWSFRQVSSTLVIGQPKPLSEFSGWKLKETFCLVKAFYNKFDRNENGFLLTVNSCRGLLKRPCTLSSSAAWKVMLALT